MSFFYPTLGNFWEITKKHTHTHVLGMRKHWYKQKINAFLLPNPKDPGCQVCFFLRVRDFPPIKDGFETINRGVNSSQMGGNPENPGWVDRSAVTIPGHWSSRLDEQRLDFAMKFSTVGWLDAMDGCPKNSPIFYSQFLGVCLMFLFLFDIP